ncbi:uncharacterized protein N7483_001455 [Penicillium malachiteum]|uniref:uncharacterized protein n=1 Tax=Penicillium malachiteum TaxID=1324776 RepID=UPI002546C7B4|nr:uncharacterized protein N7483_001455 [Penicillium malachiteum]KAJ5736330.1 hypothetical protein N7483_001455 [Penicillium malachiteum]
MAPKHGQRPHLQPGELTLLDYATDDTHDVVTLSDKELLILQLAQQVQEQQLEKALLEQEREELSGDNAEEELAIAERELLEARATYTLRKKAAQTVLMTDPILKAVHLKANTPLKSTCMTTTKLMALLRFINRRDELALAHENLGSAHNEVLKRLSDLEVQNLHINRDNQELVSQLLDLTKQDSSWRERLKDASLASQLDTLEAEHRTSKAQWERMKNIASAMVVGSGLNWADDDDLRALVLDESDD